MSDEQQTALDTSHYVSKREADWAAFTSEDAPLEDHWERWKEESFGWRPEIAFFQPVGTDYPELGERLEPLRAALEPLEEIELPPIPFMHLETLRLGFLRAEDIYWSQVETFYVSASPRIHRVEPFKLSVGGVSAGPDGLYLGVDDELGFREVRKQISIGVTKAYQVLKDAGITPGDSDPFIPRIPFAYFTGKGDRARVVEAISPFLDADLGEYPVSHIKLGRIGPDPEIRYPQLDVIAEIGLLGKDHRKGYHN